MSTIATKLKETIEQVPAPAKTTEKVNEKPSSNRGRRTKEVQENKPPIAQAALSKSKGFVENDAAAVLVQANNKSCTSNDNINNIIKTRKLLKSPVKSYPIISPLWSTNSSESNSGSPKKNVLSTTYRHEPRSRYSTANKLNSSVSNPNMGGKRFGPRKSDAYLLNEKECSNSTSIYDDIDLDFRKLDNEDASIHHQLQLLNHSRNQRLSTRSRSSSRSFSIENFGVKSSPSESADSNGDHSNSTDPNGGLSSTASSVSLKSESNQRKRRTRRSSPNLQTSFGSKRSTKRMKID